MNLTDTGAGRIAAAVFVLLAVACPSAGATDEPAFTVEAVFEDFEVRRYAPFVIAEIAVPGGFEEAGTDAFDALFAYISGANRGTQKMDMTAPVLQAPSRGTALPMTAPVLQRSAADAGTHLVSFVLPLDYTLETAPVPTDERIRIREVPARDVAALRYSGFWSEANYREQESRLLAAVTRAGFEPVGAPQWARYNAPFVPWFLRRNEVLIVVRRAGAAG